MTRLCSLALVLGSVTLLAACGGDDGEEGGGSLTAQADAICIETGEQSAEYRLENAPPASVQEEAESARAGVERYEEATTELEALEAPEEQAAAWEEFLAAREDLTAANEERASALEKGDVPAAQKASGRASDIDERENDAAAALGLEACAEQLPEDQEQLARETVEEIEVGGEVERVCGELVLDDYVESAYGRRGAAGCEKFYENEAQLADSVKIEDVQGTEGGTAVVIFEDVGGRYAGEPSIANLVYVDGAWKLWSLSALSS